MKFDNKIDAIKALRKATGKLPVIDTGTFEMVIKPTMMGLLDAKEMVEGIMDLGARLASAPVELTHLDQMILGDAFRLLRTVVLDLYYTESNRPYYIEDLRNVEEKLARLYTSGKTW